MVDGDRLGDEFSSAVIMFHEAIGRHLGLTAADHKALGLIERHGPLTAGDLARLTGLTPGAVTGLVDRLEKAGYVERRADPDDRRRVLLASHHPQDLSAVYESLTRDVAEFSANYTAEDWKVIVDYITNMISVLRNQTRKLSEHSGPDIT